jgi:hypothetical protein
MNTALHPAHVHPMPSSTPATFSAAARSFPVDQCAAAAVTPRTPATSSYLVIFAQQLWLDGPGGEVTRHVPGGGIRVVRGFVQVGQGEACRELAADLPGE